MRAMPLRKIVICGVCRDGNVSDGLLRIQKYLRAAMQVSFNGGWSKAFSTKEGYKKCNLLLGDRRRGEGEATMKDW